MFSIAKVGNPTTNVGGPPIIGPGAPTVFAEGSPVSCSFDVFGGHGEAPHTTGFIPGGCPTVFAMGRNVHRSMLSVATCGHPVQSFSTVKVGM